MNIVDFAGAELPEERRTVDRDDAGLDADRLEHRLDGLGGEQIDAAARIDEELDR